MDKKPEEMTVEEANKILTCPTDTNGPRGKVEWIACEKNIVT